MKNQVTYEHIKERIMNGTYRPAQRLLESQLAEEIGVSRNTVKKALMAIEREKLITIEDNRGATVTSLSFDEVLEYLEIRIELEKIIGKYSVRNITEAELDQLEQYWLQMKEAILKEEFETYSACNRNFHKIIYEASKHTLTTGYILSIKTQIHHRFQFKPLALPGRAQQSLNDHYQILLALKERNEEKVIAKMQEHVQNLVNCIIANRQLLM